MDFYSTNLGRAYPLQSTSDLAADAILVDLKLVLRSRAAYSHTRSHANLSYYGKLTNELRDRLGAAEGDTHFVIFSVVTDRKALGFLGFGDANCFQSIRLKAFMLDQLQDAVLGNRDTPPTPVPSLGNGWAVLGEPDAFPDTFRAVSIPIEPSRILATTEPGPSEAVTHLYNAPHVQYSPALGCLDQDSHGIQDRYYLATPPIHGAFRVDAGNQLSIYQDQSNRLIVIRADGSAGDSEPVCDPIPLSTVDGPLDDTDAAPRCGEVVHSLNGLSKSDVVVAGYNGVTVRGYPSLNRIVINAPVRSGEDCESIRLGDDPPDIELNPPEPCEDFDPDFDPSKLPFSRSGMNLGKCRFVADGSLNWQIDNYGCVSPTFCQSPNYLPAQPGEVAITACLLADDSLTIIRNGYFGDLVPLNFWERSAGVSLIKQANSFVNAQQLPMAQMLNDQWLQQRLLGVLPSQAHALQADIKMLSGTLAFVISDATTGRRLWSETYNNTASHHTAVFSVPPLGSSLVDLHIRYTGAGDPAFIGYLALNPQ